MKQKTLKERFNALSPKTKKQLVVVASMLLFAVVFMLLYRAANVGKTKNENAQQQTLQTTDFTENDKNTSLKVGFDKKLDAMMKRIDDLESGKTQQSEQSQQEEQQKTAAEDAAKYNRPMMFNNLNDVPVPDETKDAYPQPKYQENNQYQAQAPAKPTEKIVSKIGFMSIADKTNSSSDEPKDIKKKKQNWIPSNSIFKATLVTGVYAPTLAKGKQSPYPVVLRLKDLSFFPNEFRKDLSGCFIGGEAYGNLSDERVNVRLNNLSCLSENNISVIDVPVSGFVQGEDGIIGLAGRVVSKQGQIMAAAFVASFLQGMGEAFSLANQTSTISGMTGTTTTAISGDDIIKYGAGSGFSESFKMLSKYYTDILNDTSPVIEVLGGREVEVIINKGVDINPEEWEWTDIK